MYTTTGSQPRYFPATQMLIALLILAAIAAALLFLPTRIAASTEEKKAIGVKDQVQLTRLFNSDGVELSRESRVDTSRVCDLSPVREQSRPPRNEGDRSMLDRLPPVPRLGGALLFWFSRLFTLPPMETRVDRE